MSTLVKLVLLIIGILAIGIVVTATELRDRETHILDGEEVIIERATIITMDDIRAEITEIRGNLERMNADKNITLTTCESECTAYCSQEWTENYNVYSERLNELNDYARNAEER